MMDRADKLALMAAAIAGGMPAPVKESGGDAYADEALRQALEIEAAVDGHVLDEGSIGRCEHRWVGVKTDAGADDGARLLCLNCGDERSEDELAVLTDEEEREQDRAREVRLAAQQQQAAIAREGMMRQQIAHQVAQVRELKQQALAIWHELGSAGVPLRDPRAPEGETLTLVERVRWLAERMQDACGTTEEDERP